MADYICCRLSSPDCNAAERLASFTTRKTLDFHKVIPNPHARKADRKNPYWEPWNRANWGTKWNASRGRIEDGALFFATPWDAPLPVIAKLSQLLPGIRLELEWHHEGGVFIGRTAYLNGSYIIL